jgi:tetratricopeptide (TPR) repeat protein
MQSLPTEVIVRVSVVLALLLGWADGLGAQVALDRPVPVLDPGGHTGRVWKVLFTPDGTRVVSVSADKTIRVWNVDSGRTVRVLRPPFGEADKGVLFAATISPDGKTLAVGGIENESSGAIYLIHLATGRLERVLRGHKKGVLSLDFTRRGRLASGSFDQTARIWDTKTGRCEHVLKHHKGPLDAVAFSPDSRYLAVASRDKTASIWCARKGWKISLLTGHEQEVYSVAWRPDGRVVATGSADQSIRIWDPDGSCRQQILRLHNGVLSLSFTPDGSELLVTRGHTSARYYCSLLVLATQRERVWFKGHTGPVKTGVIAPDGKYAATAGARGDELFLWRTWDASLVHRLAPKIHPAMSVAWSPGGTTVGWGCADAPRAGSDLRLERTFDLVSLSPGSPPDKTFHKAKYSLGTRTLEFQRGRLVLKDGIRKPATIFDPKDQTRQIRCFTLLPGKRIAVGTDEGLYLTGILKRWLPGNNSAVMSLAPSPSGRHLLAARGDGCLEIRAPEWDEPLLCLAFVGRDWLAWTPAGYHAGTPVGLELLGWFVQRGPEAMGTHAPTSTFLRRYHRPDIVAGVATALQGRAVTEDRVLSWVQADLARTRPADRPFARYLTLSHLYNAALGEWPFGRRMGELPAYRNGLSKLINSLSWATAITRPRPIDPLNLILRIDLRDYGWDARLWDQITDAYPYSIQRGHPAAKAVASTTACRKAVIRADWFAAVASQPPLYHRILKLPRIQRTLERKFGIDPVQNRQNGRVVRAGLSDSSVSYHNRLLERHPIERNREGHVGAYWRSFDFASSVGRKSIFAHPLGPGPDTFEEDGGEIIFSLPNGLQGYFLTDAKGQRIDRAPTEIVRDTDGRLPAVTNGVSCIACHHEGLNAHNKGKTDRVRNRVEEGRWRARAFSTQEAERVRKLYPLSDDFSAIQQQDSKRFGEAVAHTLYTDSLGSEPTWALVGRYLAVLDLPLAAAEVGLPPEEFARKLTASPALVRELGLLPDRGSTVKREVFEAAFPRLVRECGLGEVAKQEPHLAEVDAARGEQDNLPADPVQTPWGSARTRSWASWVGLPLVLLLAAFLIGRARLGRLARKIRRLLLPSKNVWSRATAARVVALTLITLAGISGWAAWRWGRVPPEDRQDASTAEQTIAAPRASRAVHRESARRLLARGQEHLAQDEYDRAVSAFTEAIKQAPASWAAYEGRGVAYMRTADLDHAEEDFSSAIAHHPAASNSYRERGVVRRQKGDLDFALTDLNRALRLNQTDAEAICERAHVYREKGRFNEALADCRAALSLEPDHAEPRHCRAQVYAEQGKYDLALREATAATDLDPENSSYHLERSVAHRRLGRHAEADADLERALGVPPSTAHDHCNRGEALLAQKDYHAAIASFTNAARLQPRFGWAYAGRAKAHAELLSWGEAAANYAEAIRLLPGEPELLVGRGQAGQQNGDANAAADFARAISGLTRRIKSDPLSPAGWEQRGRAHHLAESPERALADYERALRLDRRCVPALVGRGQVYLERRDLKSARAAFDAALAVAPAHIPGLLGRAVVCNHLGEHNRSIRDSSEVIRLNPASAQGYLARGTAFLMRGDLLEAARDLEDALKVNPKSARARGQIGVLLLKKGLHDRAAANFSEAIRHEPKNAELYHGRAQALHLQGKSEQALADINEAMRLARSSVNTLVLRGWIHVSLGANELAWADFERALRIDKRWAPAYEGRAWIHYRRRKKDEALNEFREALQLGLRSSPTRHALGLIYLEKHQYADSLGNLDEALRLDPKLHKAYHDRAWVRRLRRDFTGSLADVKAACGLVPGYADASWLHADYGRRVAEETDALSRDGRNAESYRCRAVAHYHRGAYHEAISDLTALLRLKPKDSAALAERGAARNRVGAHKTAIRDLTEAVRLNCEDAMAFCELALARVQLGYRRQAERDCRKALAIAPGLPAAHYALGRVLAARGKYKEALRAYTAAIRLQPNFAFRALRGRSLAHRKLGAVKAARADCLAATTLQPRNAGEYTIRAWANNRLRNFDRGIADCNEALKLKPGDGEVYAERARSHLGKAACSDAIRDVVAAVRMGWKPCWLRSAQVHAANTIGLLDS